MDCSKTEVFIKEMMRMCANTNRCYDCLLYDDSACAKCCMMVSDLTMDHVHDVQEWSDKNPDEHPEEATQ